MQIQNICDIRRFKLAEDVEREIGKLPKSLKGSYDSIYESINGLPETAKLVAKRTISWLLCAQRPLESLELIAAITIDGPKQPISNEDILSACCNLVVYDGVSQHFRFAHLSVREYLESRPEYSPAEIHLEACYACLSTWNSPKVDRKKLPNGWVSYAADYLLLHLRKLEITSPPYPSGLDNSLLRFIRIESDAGLPYFDWAELAGSRDRLFNIDIFIEKGRFGIITCHAEIIILSHPFSLFAAFGLPLAMDRILHTHRLHLSRGQRDECVRAAALRNNMTTLKLLIANKFSVPPGVVLYLLEYFPYDLREKLRMDQQRHRTKEIMAIFLKAIPTVTEDMLDAACRNRFASCEVVQQLFNHDPGLQITKQRFIDELLRGRIQLCSVLATRLPSLTTSAKFNEVKETCWGDDTVTPICIFVSEAILENPKEMFDAIVGSSEPRLLESFLRRTDFQKDWITERVLKIVGKKKPWGKEMLSALIDYNTERVIHNAPFDDVAKLADPHVLNQYLSKHCDAPITWDILLAAARNGNDNTSLQLLLDQERTTSLLTKINYAEWVNLLPKSPHRTNTVELLNKYGLLKREDPLQRHKSAFTAFAMSTVGKLRNHHSVEDTEQN